MWRSLREYSIGPLLFSIYVNDLPEVPRHCSTECYVDDTKLFVSFNLHDSQRIVQEMNEDLPQVRNWCFGNQRTESRQDKINCFREPTDDL